MTDNKNETAGPPKEDVQPVPNQEQTSDNKPPESSQAPTIVNAVPVTSEHQNPPSTEEQKREERRKEAFEAFVETRHKTCFETRSKTDNSSN